MSAGTKRPHEDGSRGASSKPRDWRDAFFGDEEERPARRDDREYRDRDRPSHRDRGYDRHDRDDRSNGRRDDQRDRERYGDRRSVNKDSREYRDRDQDRRGSDRYGDRDHRRDRQWQDQSRYDADRRRHAHPGYRDGHDREEGEIESPPRPPAQSTSHGSATSANPGIADGSLPPNRSSFQSVSVPSGPRSTAAPSRPPASASHLLDRSQPPASGSSPNEPEPVVVLEDEQDPEKALEARRKKREEIMAKFKAHGNRPTPTTTGPVDQKPLGNGAESVTSGGTKTAERSGVMTGTTTGPTPLLKALGIRSTNLKSDTPNPPDPSMPSTPLGKDFDLTKQAETTGDAVLPSEAKEEGAGISAADYDPTRDKKDDEVKRHKDSELADGMGEPVKREAPPEEDEWEEVEIEEEEEDEDLDMFAAFGDEEQPKKKRKVTVRRRKNAQGGDQETVRPKKQSVLDVVDNVDDTDGYYRITPGEILDDGRYQVTITLGKGMFSAVVKAKILKAVGQERRQDVVGKEVAIKVIRSQESMYVAGRKEAQILKKLNDADPEDKKHIVRMERQFEHRGHLCIVTESLSMNLRDVIKRFGKDVGLNMRAVRAYAHQMFLALSLMRKCSIVHADIKPDNILVTENKATLKVCDLGSAAEVAEGEITPYLVSRFYRAPEIILGLPYDTSIDVWSVACTLYELYTGKILFPGRSNNHMLLLMMEVKGKFNHRMIKKASLGEMHFDETMNFISIEKDKITGQDTLKTLAISKATRDLRSRLLPSSSVQLKMKDDELKLLNSFVDLLDKCLHLDPAKRMTPREAMLHPFLSGH